MSTRVQTVSQLLRDGIMRGSYPGGFRMNEVDLATEFGVSRTPIRAALSALAAEGLLEYTPNAGYAVRSYSAKDILGVYEARAALEGLAARQAVENGLDDDQRERMGRVIRETEAMLDRDARGEDSWGEEAGRRWAQANVQFHTPIVEASQNDHLHWLLRKSRHIPLVHATLHRVVDLKRIARAHEEHIYILEALRNRQAVRAEALAREHIYKAGVFVVERMRQAEVQRETRIASKRPRPHPTLAAQGPPSPALREKA
ncbi:GntR family transcriptional regulator [Roseiarcaceae bacterium H3SJ34-1]|uniref:GntR family transcriptional regulator n=1 Tax=Terripilifer ovatus TaxID=3032367 RepID=UPI003AB9B292|nr:GntR family transcriptional regulator [Roseiarcaceae bacterium H3SJ34-1]